MYLQEIPSSLQDFTFSTVFTLTMSQLIKDDEVQVEKLLIVNAISKLRNKMLLAKQKIRGIYKKIVETNPIIHIWCKNGKF